VKVSTAVKEYIAWKHSLGIRFTSIERFFLSFTRQMEGRELGELTTAEVTRFLNRTRVTSPTWQQNYDKLDRFFRYLRIAGKTNRNPMPRRVPRTPSGFVPYIYSRAEIKRLTDRAIIKKVARRPLMDVETFRTLLLFLYGTGVSVGEALNLRKRNINFRSHVIRIARHQDSPFRKIPVSHDVGKLLTKFLTSPARRSIRCGYVFATTKGTKLSPVTVIGNFQRLRRYARVTAPDNSYHQPRMHDLRSTFAVHRIESWYREGIDVYKMIPALAAYMGRVGLSVDGKVPTSDSCTLPQTS
jgi:integrase/recombinase XerD